MKKLMTAVSEWLAEGEDVILATIIADSGSTPRGAGARMAIISDGRFVGTVGGGAVEYKVQQMADGVLKEKRSLLKSFILAPNEKEDLGMVCGGSVTVYLQYIAARDGDAKKLFAYGSSLFSQNTDSWLVADITDEADRRMAIYDASNLPAAMRGKGMFASRGIRAEIDGRKYYSEPLTKAGSVYVFGGGHVSQELVPLLSHLGFSCRVFDSLPKFASKELFPTADETITGDFENISERVNITGKDYVVIMTRGHASDFTVQAQVLKNHPRYVGVIGSRAKIAAVSKKLLEQGFSQEVIDSVHTPIGLNIKADTPAEIAVSIAAEMIMIRAETSR